MADKNANTDANDHLAITKRPVRPKRQIVSSVSYHPQENNNADFPESSPTNVDTPMAAAAATTNPTTTFVSSGVTNHRHEPTFVADPLVDSVSANTAAAALHASDVSAIAATVGSEENATDAATNNTLPSTKQMPMATVIPTHSGVQSTMERPARGGTRIVAPNRQRTSRSYHRNHNNTVEDPEIHTRVHASQSAHASPAVIVLKSTSSVPAATAASAAAAAVPTATTSAAVPTATTTSATAAAVLTTSAAAISKKADPKGPLNAPNATHLFQKMQIPNSPVDHKSHGDGGKSRTTSVSSGSTSHRHESTNPAATTKTASVKFDLPKQKEITKETVDLLRTWWHNPNMLLNYPEMMQKIAERPRVMYAKAIQHLIQDGKTRLENQVKTASGSDPAHMYLRFMQMLEQLRSIEVTNDGKVELEFKVDNSIITLPSVDQWLLESKNTKQPFAKDGKNKAERVKSVETTFKLSKKIQLKIDKESGTVTLLSGIEVIVAGGMGITVGGHTSYNAAVASVWKDYKSNRPILQVDTHGQPLVEIDSVTKTQRYVPYLSRNWFMLQVTAAMKNAIPLPAPK